MESMIEYFLSLDFDLETVLKYAGILLAVPLVLALLGRFVFGKKSVFCSAVSSSVGIIFIYAVTAVLINAGEAFQQFVTPLPFVTFTSDSMVLFSFEADYTVVCAQILSMVILAFLTNLVNSWLPTGKRVLSWLFFRCLCVVLAMILHVVATGLLTTYLPHCPLDRGSVWAGVGGCLRHSTWHTEGALKTVPG